MLGLAPSWPEPGRVLYVGSKPVLVPGSIEDNLLLNADPEVRVEDPEALAAFVSGVTSGALRFPIGETVVGPNGRVCRADRRSWSSWPGPFIAIPR